jgi:hypothetical protein
MDISDAILNGYMYPEETIMGDAADAMLNDMLHPDYEDNDEEELTVLYNVFVQRTDDDNQACYYPIMRNGRMYYVGSATEQEPTGYKKYSLGGPIAFALEIRGKVEVKKANEH